MVTHKISGELESFQNIRLEIWSTFFEEFKNSNLLNLIFGKGLSRDLRNTGFIFGAPHNLILFIFSLSGIIGLSLFLFIHFLYNLIVLKAIKTFKSFNIKKSLSFLYVGYIALMLDSMFIDPLYHFPLWSLMGMSIGIVKFKKWGE